MRDGRRTAPVRTSPVCWERWRRRRSWSASSTAIRPRWDGSARSEGSESVHWVLPPSVSPAPSAICTASTVSMPTALSTPRRGFCWGSDRREPGGRPLHPGSRSGALFRQDELVVARAAQAVELALVPDQQFRSARQELVALDHLGGRERR